MRPIANFAFHSILAVALAAFAATGAAAAGYLKLGGVEGETARQSTRDEWVKVEGRAMPAATGEGKKDFYKGWIELNSWSWGESRAAGDPDRPIVAGRLPNAAKEGTEKGGTEDINIGVGELQEATVSKSMDKSSPKLMEASAKGKVFTSPAPRGSMTTFVPAGTCRVGARYPKASLDTGTMIFEMENIMVSSCSTGSGGGGGSLPMEEISFNYGRIKTVYNAQDRQAPKAEVRSWDPDKKKD